MHIDRNTHKVPLATNFSKPTEAELTKSDYMLDPTKDRLGDHFSPPIVPLTFCAGQPLGHAAHWPDNARDRSPFDSSLRAPTPPTPPRPFVPARQRLAQSDTPNRLTLAEATVPDYSLPLRSWAKARRYQPHYG